MIKVVTTVAGDVHVVTGNGVCLGSIIQNELSEYDFWPEPNEAAWSIGGLRMLVDVLESMAVVSEKESNVAFDPIKFIRERLEMFVAKATVRDMLLPSYIPATTSERKEFIPHQWVIDVVAGAYQQGKQDQLFSERELEQPEIVVSISYDFQGGAHYMPHCEKAKTLSRMMGLTGVKDFTIQRIEDIKSLGFAVRAHKPTLPDYL